MVMKTLHENQQKILDTLLENPDGRTLDQLSKTIGVTNTATKAHVLRLIHLGHVSHRDKKGGVGRPKRIYVLTEQGQEVFPRQYSWISMMLLEYLAENKTAAELSAIMEQLADKVVLSLDERLATGVSGAQGFKQINVMLNELGYRSRLNQSDSRKGVVIEASNCVYHSVAKKHPQLCQFDVSLIEKMSGKKARLETCIAKGDAVCRFCLNR